MLIACDYGGCRWRSVVVHPERSRAAQQHEDAVDEQGNQQREKCGDQDQEQVELVHVRGYVRSLLRK